jgi:hypothetical protein
VLELLGFLFVKASATITIIIIVGNLRGRRMVGGSRKTIDEGRNTSVGGGGGGDGTDCRFPLRISVFISTATLTAPTSHSLPLPLWLCPKINKWALGPDIGPYCGPDCPNGDAVGEGKIRTRTPKSEIPFSLPPTLPLSHTHTNAEPELECFVELQRWGRSSTAKTGCS